jgi:hypothetical protein
VKRERLFGAIRKLFRRNTGRKEGRKEQSFAFVFEFLFVFVSSSIWRTPHTAQQPEGWRERNGRWRIIRMECQKKSASGLNLPGLNPSVRPSNSSSLFLSNQITIPFKNMFKFEKREEVRKFPSSNFFPQSLDSKC